VWYLIKKKSWYQYWGTGAGTTTFCLSGTGTGMHSGSGSISVLELALDPDPTYNVIQKSKKYLKNQKREANFIGNIASSNIKNARFCTHFLITCAIYGLDPFSGFFGGSGTGSGTEPEPKPEQRLLQSRNRNRNKSLRFHNTL
jgi:hypothetical protein